ncbi:MAG: hypothetical protein JRJ87_16310 [Deltaproteobacteria bacterium]|nr:hypothetical protein [Deltaproteobacteria bacterium]
MKQEEITAMVKQELEGADFDNWHGITRANISDFLVEPVMDEYEGENEDDGIRKYWTVLHECRRT